MAADFLVVGGYGGCGGRGGIGRTALPPKGGGDGVGRHHRDGIEKSSRLVQSFLQPRVDRVGVVVGEEAAIYVDAPDVGGEVNGRVAEVAELREGVEFAGVHSWLLVGVLRPAACRSG